MPTLTMVSRLVSRLVSRPVSRPVSRLVPLLVMTVAAAAQPADVAAPIDFERGTPGQPPPGWFVPTGGYRVVLSGDDARAGSQCALFERSAEAGGQPAGFGNLMRNVDAAPFRGRRVRLTAAVRTDLAGAGDRVQMWMRVDRQGGARGFFDNMGDRPIRGAAWRDYTIEGVVHDDAVSIAIGFMLLRDGRVFVDDVRFETLGAVAIAAPEGPRPLTARGLENVVAFTRLLGYVRHFHPSDAAAGTDWDAFAIAGVRAVEPAADAPALAAALTAHFAPVAPTVRVAPTGVAVAPMPALRPPEGVDEMRVVMWTHHGVKLSEGGMYRSWRQFMGCPEGVRPALVPDPADPLVADLGGGVSCVVPTALYADGDGTLPRGPAAEAPASVMPTSGADRATRLAAVALGWNVFQHFYGYFDVVDADWPGVLRTAITKAATDEDEYAFLLTLRRMVAALRDGHGNVWHHADRATATLPLIWDWAEDRLVITGVDGAVPATAGLERGDVVLRINGQAAAAALADAESYISGSPQWRRYRGLSMLARGAMNDTASLVVRSAGGEPRQVRLKYGRGQAPLTEPRPEHLGAIADGVLYIDVNRFKDGDLAALQPRLAGARGLVVDFRAYPKSPEVQRLIGRLIDEPVTCAQWHVPTPTAPDRVGMTFAFSNWPIAPTAPRIETKIAFVTDASAISAAETYLAIVEHYRLAPIVGAPTAAANGNVNPFELPGGYRVVWTGMKVLKHDGSQHHLVGIRPTVPVARTVAGIRAGRDELLERAVAVVME